MADYKFAATTFVATSHLNSELIMRLSKRLLHYVKFNSKGFDSEIDREATRVSIPEQLQMRQFICADLPLARMPARSDKQEEETSSEDDCYHQYSSDDDNSQEREDKAPKAKKNVIKLTIRDSSHEDNDDEGSTSRGKKRPQKDSEGPTLKKAKVPEQDEEEESLEKSDDEEDDDVDDDSESSEEESTATRSQSKE